MKAFQYLKGKLLLFCLEMGNRLAFLGLRRVRGGMPVERDHGISYRRPADRHANRWPSLVDSCGF